MKNVSSLVLSLCVLAGPVISSAAVITFSTDPFAGSTALTTPGRQVNGLGEVFLPTFDTKTDKFAFDVNVPAYGAVGPLKFANGFASTIGSYPTDANVIVLFDQDNDNNSATAFNAGSAANLIAAALPDVPNMAGFFIYWNSSLSVNRLVYSTNLSDPTADLSILARIQSPTGTDAIGQLPKFGASNFEAVPEPSSIHAMGVAAAAFLVRRKSK